VPSGHPAPADVTWLDRAQGRPIARGGIAHHPAARELRFRTYRLIPGSRLLLRKDRPVSIGARAFDLLHVLLAARGMVVSKDELVRRVWPGIFVEECNLRFQVAALRTVLAADRDLIKTVNGRGYLMADDAGFGASPTLPSLDSGVIFT
jgi:DNA-binding winged helix-turn-helix (wHTH) protein